MKRTAVVVVHGMGQQEPGSLQRSLGRALAGEGDTMYVAPDRISGRTDTHRVTIAHPAGDETHVYEHYWSDRFQETRLRHVLPWTMRLLRHRHLGPRLGGRNGLLELTVGGIAAIPYLLLVLSAVLGNRADVADLLEEVATLGVLLSIVLVAFTVTKLFVRSHVGAAGVGALAGVIGALMVEPDFGTFEFATAAFVLLWAPGWLMVMAGLRGVGPIAFIRTVLVVAVLVPFCLSVIDARLLSGGLPAAITVTVIGFWFRHWIGDVARYLDHSAANAEETDRLRRDASNFLWNLCFDQRYDYDEVVLIAHSQGGFVAYDALTSVWQRWAVDHDIDFEESVAISDIDRLSEAGDRTNIEWGAAVSELQDALHQRTMPWKVRHFVTLGSPIGHASGLLANGTPDLHRMALDRSVATCPPRLHGDPPSVAYQGRDGRRFHHTSVFAATKWTNVVYANDLLGGPVDGGGLGGEVRNILLGDGEASFSPTLLDFALLFPHDAYWKSPKPAFDKHVATTLDLLRHITTGD